MNMVFLYARCSLLEVFAGSFLGTRRYGSYYLRVIVATEVRECEQAGVIRWALCIFSTKITKSLRFKFASPTRCVLLEVREPFIENWESTEMTPQFDPLLHLC